LRERGLLMARDYDYIDWTAIEAISVVHKSGAKKTIN
jgi:hypothetical protein